MGREPPRGFSNELGVAALLVFVAVLAWSVILVAYMALTGDWESTAAVKVSFLFPLGVGLGYLLGRTD
jgi:hypothetical protein